MDWHSWESDVCGAIAGSGRVKDEHERRGTLRTLSITTNRRVFILQDTREYIVAIERIVGLFFSLSPPNSSAVIVQTSSGGENCRLRSPIMRAGGSSLRVTEGGRESASVCAISTSLPLKGVLGWRHTTRHSACLILKRFSMSLVIRRAANSLIVELSLVFLSCDDRSEENLRRRRKWWRPGRQTALFATSAWIAQCCCHATTCSVARACRSGEFVLLGDEIAWVMQR